MSFLPTDEQMAIRDFIAEETDHLQIRAHAGAAKTSTLEYSAPAVPASQRPAALAFNVKIKAELEKRLPDYFTVLTVNGAGHRAWARTIGKQPYLDDRKLGNVVSAVLREKGRESNRTLWKEVRELADCARSTGMVPSVVADRGTSFVPDAYSTWQTWGWDKLIDVTEEKKDLVRQVLIRVIDMGFNGVIDYNDQIYLSSCFGGSFEKHGTVFVDEAQDLSLLNHHMLYQIVQDRLIAVGDHLQSIYLFRGSMSDSMDRLAETFSPMHRLELSTTFRCSKAVVAHVEGYAPGIQAADWAPEGNVETLTGLNIEDIRPGSLIACRVHAPLIQLGMRLLAAGIPATFVKSDIRKSVENLIHKLARDDPETKTYEFLNKLERLAMTAQESDTMVERIDCIRVLAEGTRTVGDILRKVEAIFAVEGAQITLGTGHAVKGLEFDTVYHLDRWRIPSPFAKTPEQKRQEMNVAHVIATRAKKDLFYVKLDQIR